MRLVLAVALAIFASAPSAFPALGRVDTSRAPAAVDGILSALRKKKLMSVWFRIGLLSLVFWGAPSAHTAETVPVPFVMQMTIGDSDAQRRAFLQIAKVLQDIGPQKVRIEVIAYEGGIASLLAGNNDTAMLIAALAREGVRFKACRISMRGHGYNDADFPLEVEFVPAGASEMVRLQMEGYRYWRP